MSVNTGLTRLAGLLGVPTIGLHGPTNPKPWGPIGKTTAMVPRSAKGYLNLNFNSPGRFGNPYDRFAGKGRARGEGIRFQALS